MPLAVCTRHCWYAPGCLHAALLVCPWLFARGTVGMPLAVCTRHCWYAPGCLHAALLVCPWLFARGTAGMPLAVAEALTPNNPNQPCMCSLPLGNYNYQIIVASVCSRPEDGLRCRQGVKPPLNSTQLTKISIDQ